MKTTARETAVLNAARASRDKIDTEAETILMKYGTTSEVETYIQHRLIVNYDELKAPSLMALIERGDKNLLLQYAQKYHLRQPEHIDKIISLYDDETIEEVTKCCMWYAANDFRVALLRANKHKLCVKIFDIILANNLPDKEESTPPSHHPFEGA